MCNNLNIQYFVMYVQYYLVIYSIILWYIACGLWCMCICEIYIVMYVYYLVIYSISLKIYVCCATPHSTQRVADWPVGPSISPVLFFLFFNATSLKPLDKISWNFVVMNDILCKYRIFNGNGFFQILDTSCTAWRDVTTVRYFQNVTIKLLIKWKLKLLKILVLLLFNG